MMRPMLHGRRQDKSMLFNGALNETPVFTIPFELLGNPRDPQGNPLPKIKATKGMYWTDKVKDYQDWKHDIVKAFLDACPDEIEGVFQAEMAEQVIKNKRKHQKPIRVKKGERWHLCVDCYWKNGVHPDAENVAGAIADALFFNDKDLELCATGGISSTKQGKVVALLTIQSEYLHGILNA